jgi:hypothetical protein
MTSSKTTSFFSARKKTFGAVNESVKNATKAPLNGATEVPKLVNKAEDIEVIPEYIRAKKMVDARVPLIFVTGGAGTGKSTFIRWIDQEFRGETILCAPTGIAALTIFGKTIHSLCRLPPAWIVDQDIKHHPKSLVALAKILVIDEISMVNANLLDAIDKFLKLNRKSDKPFGGITVIMVGDLFQLPPIVTRETKSLFEKEYDSPKFFSAHAISKTQFEVIELTKAFRQVDQHFVDLLSDIREGKNLDKSIEELNSSCYITTDPPLGSVSLSPRHVDVERVNNERLNKLRSEPKTYFGVKTGLFRDNQLPVPLQVHLKIGAQVMLANNTKEWVNGSVATVTKLMDDTIHVSLNSQGKDLVVPMNNWDQFDYKLNQNTNAIERIVVGTYRQLPVILAWAMTIHKSQGLTLEKVHLDLGIGSFETGQTYVALSRCRSLETLSLARPVQSQDVKVDPESSVFYSVIRDD